jgi:outer membrane immunogenic protein
MSVAKSVRVCALAVGAMLSSLPAQGADVYGGYKDQGGYRDYGGYRAEPVFVPLPTWQGFHVGGHLGGAWSNVDPVSNVIFLNGGGTIAVSGFSNSGIVGGFQFGYDIQWGNFLYGIEADFGGMDNTASARFYAPGRVLYVNSAGGFYGDITGRGGFILGNTLIYAKGGFAFFTGDIQVSDPVDLINQNSGTFTGWTIGAGVEYQISPRWTVKAEYLYYDFDNSNFSCCSGYNSNRLDNSLTMNTVKIGFNYIFHSFQSPLY